MNEWWQLRWVEDGEEGGLGDRGESIRRYVFLLVSFPFPSGFFWKVQVSD